VGARASQAAGSPAARRLSDGAGEIGVATTWDDIAGARRARRTIDLPSFDKVMRHAAPAISLVVLGAAILALRMLDLNAVLAMVPRSPLFWLVFLAVYSVPVAADYAIYRRIWRLPLAGLVPLARKQIGNELVMGYFGDAYLYSWAHKHGFAGKDGLRTVKDVAIMSAVASNVTTMTAAVVALPYLGLLALHIPVWTAAAAIALVVTPPLVAILFARKLFTLPPVLLRWALGLHFGRALASCTLTALLWHLALPAVALKYWLVFAALKLILSRLPNVSSKDMLLAGLAIVLLGRHADVATLLTMIATITIAAHVAVSLALSGRELLAGVVSRVGGRAASADQRLERHRRVGQRRARRRHPARHQSPSLSVIAHHVDAIQRDHRPVLEIDNGEAGAIDRAAHDQFVIAA
jgi:hypothetical protein